MANQLGKPAIGVFDEQEAFRYCSPSQKCKAVTYSGAPDSSTVEKVAQMVISLNPPAREGN
jgi:hypothetical protein